MKEFFKKTGAVLYVVSTWILSLLPIAALDLPWWADFLIISALGTLDGMLLCIPSLALWIVGLVVVFGHPVNWFSILYIVTFVVKIALFVISLVIELKSDK